MTARPLEGRRVVVTRAREQAGELAALLAEQGAVPVEVPVIAIVDAPDGGAALRRAAERAGDYDWVVFTSVNGAERFLAHAPDLSTCHVAAVGPATAAALRARGVRVDIVPDGYVAERLLAELPQPRPGGRVLLPQADRARRVLRDGLERAGWAVDAVVAYRTESVRPTDAELSACRAADAIAFTSASTVTSFVEAAGRDAVPRCVVCIGPVTAAAAEHQGMRVDAVAEPHTLEGVVAALASVLGP